MTTRNTCKQSNIWCQKNILWLSWISWIYDPGCPIPPCSACISPALWSKLEAMRYWDVLRLSELFHACCIHRNTIENIIPWKVLALAAIRSWSLYLAIMTWSDMIPATGGDTRLHKDVAAIHSCCRRLRRPPSPHYLCRSTLATGLSKSSCLRSEKRGNKHVKPRWKNERNAETCRNHFGLVFVWGLQRFRGLCFWFAMMWFLSPQKLKILRPCQVATMAFASSSCFQVFSLGATRESPPKPPPPTSAAKAATSTTKLSPPGAFLSSRLRTNRSLPTTATKWLPQQSGSTWQAGLE